MKTQIPFSNDLSAAQLERLAYLAEEMGEAIQAIGKIIRHGYESRNPLEAEGVTNREFLIEELADILYGIALCSEKKDISEDALVSACESRANSRPHLWFHHQD